MEIIKHGEVKQKYEAKCCNCGCEFIANRTETYTIATPVTAAIYHGILRKFRYCDCPDCKSMIMIEEVDMQGNPIKTEEPTEKKDEGVGILGGRIQGCQKIENCPPLDEKLLEEAKVTTADIAMAYNDIMRRRYEDNLPWWKKLLRKHLLPAFVALAAVQMCSCTHTLEDKNGIVTCVEYQKTDEYTYTVTIEDLDRNGPINQVYFRTNTLYHVGDTIRLGKPCIDIRNTADTTEN